MLLTTPITIDATICYDKWRSWKIMNRVVPTRASPVITGQSHWSVQSTSAGFVQTLVAARSSKWRGNDDMHVDTLQTSCCAPATALPRTILNTNASLLKPAGANEQVFEVGDPHLNYVTNGCDTPSARASSANTRFSQYFQRSILPSRAVLVRLARRDAGSGTRTAPGSGHQSVCMIRR